MQNPLVRTEFLHPLNAGNLFLGMQPPAWELVIWHLRHYKHSLLMLRAVSVTVDQIAGASIADILNVKLEYRDLRHVQLEALEESGKPPCLAGTSRSIKTPPRFGAWARSVHVLARFTHSHHILHSFNIVGNVCVPTLLLAKQYVRTLEIHYNRRMPQPGVFTAVQSVTLESCKTKIDFAVFGTVPELKIENYQGYVCLEPLRRRSLKSIMLRNCKNVRDVSPLQFAHTISLRECPGVTDICSLHLARCITITQCSGITQVPLLLENLRQFTACECNGLVDVSGLANATESIYLEDCKNIRLGFNSLLGCQSVVLMNLPKLCNVDFLAASDNVVINNCPGVRDVSSLGRVTSLDLQHCPGIRSVRGLGRQQRLNLKGSTGITEGMDCLRQVEDLILPMGIRTSGPEMHQFFTWAENFTSSTPGPYGAHE